MTTQGVLVVGASAAGLSTAEALRRKGYEGRLTLLDAENYQSGRVLARKTHLVHPPGDSQPRALMRNECRLGFEQSGRPRE